MKRLLPLLFALMPLNLHAFGINFTPAVVTCILSGGDCLTDTGIPFIDKLFGGGDDTGVYHTRETFCFGMLNGGSWCSGPTSYSAYDDCREIKKKLYKKALQEKGEWPSYDELKRMYPCGGSSCDYDNSHLTMIERQKMWNKPGLPRNPPIFTCTPKQSYKYLKSRCEGTRAWQEWEGHTYYRRWNYEWDKMPLETCGRNHYW